MRLSLFFFAAQQCVEGLLWLLLLGHSSVSTYWLAQSYTVFVGVLWPILPAFSLWMIEPSAQRKKWMLAVLTTGAGVAIYTLEKMMQFPVTARIADRCIAYGYPVSQPHIMLAPYVIATCAAFFFSSDATIRWLGVVNLAAFAATHHFYRYELTSVWCFFAAMIGGLIYLYFYQRNQAFSTQVSPAL